MNYLFLDLETIPCQTIEPPQFDLESVKLGNLKDPEKIKVKVQEAEEKFNADLVKNMSLDPNLCQIISCAMLLVDERGQINAGDESAIFNEKTDYGIIQALPILDKFILITWNGKHFDIPVIWKRSIIFRIPFLSFQYYLKLTHKYNNDAHIDLQLIWNQGGYGSMADCAKTLGIKHKEIMTGADVYDAWKNKEYDKIKAYNMEDVQTLYHIAKRIGVFG